MNEAWLSALGEALGEDERSEVDGYLPGLGLKAPIRAVKTWEEAAATCRAPHAAGATAGDPFLRKYALYCGGRWPLDMYHGEFSIF